MTEYIIDEHVKSQNLAQSRKARKVNLLILCAISLGELSMKNRNPFYVSRFPGNRIIGLMAVFLLIAGFPAKLPAGTPIHRNVMVFFDSNTGQTEKANIIYEDGQTVLNHLGLLPIYRDINRRPLPDDAAMDTFRGIISTFPADIKSSPEEYLSWLERQIKAGRKIVILEKFGVSSLGSTEETVNRKLRRIYRLLGFENNGDQTASQPLLRFVHQDTDRVAFERKYPLFPNYYEKIKINDPALRRYVTVKRTDRKDSESTVVFTGPFGGYAHQGYIYWQDPLTFRRKWYINPFRFFGEAFGLEAVPVPDPTTLNGLRVAFSHIDADGFSGKSKIDPKFLCSDIIRDNILKIYDFPVTVSVITGEIDPKAAGSLKLVRLAQDIFKLPNVEPASHSYSHPFYWDPKDPVEAKKYNQQYGIYIPGYSHDPAMEIDQSIQYINRLLSPPDKPARVFLWSGNCLPSEEDIARCNGLGIYNMNGGDTLFDEVNNSYSSVVPLYRRVGSRYQVYTGQANENILTNLWTGPYYGFRNIITTMERTGYPRRMAPIDIYYHFYSGEYPASLRAVQEVYEWALRQDIVRVFTSQYLQMVNDYLKATVTQDGADRYRIRDYGACLTVRFDGYKKRPDLSQSENVIGFSASPHALYVSLSPGKREALIAMAADGPTSRSLKSIPFVKKATGWITPGEITKEGVTFDYRGFGKGAVEIGGLAPEKDFQITGTAIGAQEKRSATDEKGTLRIDDLQTGRVKIKWVSPLN
jgi:polysaccharide biosynthesis protein PelA